MFSINKDNVLKKLKYQYDITNKFRLSSMLLLWMFLRVNFNFNRFCVVRLNSFYLYIPIFPSKFI